MLRLFLIAAIMAINMRCLVSQGFSNTEVLEPDMMRNKYLMLEKALWENLVSDKFRPQNDRLKAIFMEHNTFTNKFIKDHLDMEDLKIILEQNGWHKLQSEIINVHRLFVTFQQHLSREVKAIEKGQFNEEVSIDLVDHVLNPEEWPIKDTLENLHNVIVQEKLYLLQINTLADSSCELHRSAHQVLYQIYDAIVVTELKAFMMIQCSYMLLNVYKKNDYTAAAATSRSDFERKIIESLEAAVQVFEKSSRQLTRCDPETFIEGENYLQITKLLQGHIENEKDLNSERSCISTCSNYQYAKSHGCSERAVCNWQSKCQGHILYCRPFDDDMWICPGSKTNSRRYEYITYDNGRVLGSAARCNISGFHLERYWWTATLYHCDHCFCICDEQGRKSDRFFSLRPVHSDIANNMVVTGIRFVKHHRIIHLQIQEGKLMSYGKINPSSVQWSPVSKFDILDSGIKDGVDYHTLSYDRRDVDLDELTAPVGHVVTGVKFRRLGNHLNLEVRVSEINFSTGRIVNPESSHWISNDNTESSLGGDRRSEITLRWPDVPTKTRSKSKILSNPNTFIKFTHSDIGKDAAQTTLPFLDSQDVISYPPTPLQGLGLIFKGQQGYGGFIAPKMKTLDYTNNVKINQQNFKSENDL